MCKINGGISLSELFSDRELVKDAGTSEVITKTVYDGIVVAINRKINNFAFNFPEKCTDTDTPYATDTRALKGSIKAVIPKLEYPLEIKSYNEEVTEQDKLNLFDLVEYCYPLIQDVSQGDYHKFFKHYHLRLHTTSSAKDDFRNQVNQILNRNGLVFYLDVDGKIKRRLPNALGELVNSSSKLSFSDDELNNLLETAFSFISKPSDTDRKYALEKLWDALERLKTLSASKQGEKRKSTTELVKLMSDGTHGFDDVLDKEFDALRVIGNNYQIRHFETYTLKIQKPQHIDYLFFRALCLMNLAMLTLQETVDDAEWE